MLVDYHLKPLFSRSVSLSSQAILFFDGECGLCSRTIRFLIRRDKHKRLHFAPLQGVTAQTLVPTEYRESLSSVVYHRKVVSNKESQLYIRSEAVLLALIDIGGFWRLVARCARVLPLKLRDWSYNRIANNRQHLFKHTTCELPTKDVQARILP